MPEEELKSLVDEGNIQAIELALREQNLRLPVVLRELDRVLESGLGNLATALVTMLISRFSIARADKLADQVLAQQDSAGVDELVDLGAALLQQERLSAATRALSAALKKDPRDGKGLYLSARIAARRGRLEDAFTEIAKVSPKLLGGAGLATQARYAALLGREKALKAALKLARKTVSDEERAFVEHTEAIVARLELLGLGSAPPSMSNLRTAMAIEYGSLLVELARSPKDGGRFSMEPPKLGDVAAVLERMLGAIRQLGVPMKTLYFANEDGEIIAAALSEKTDCPYKQWTADRKVEDGDWLCLASAGTHPHLRRPAVQALQQALDDGLMRSLALVLPCGWRGPIVPDVVGRLTGDDEFPWAIDDEVDETVELIFEETDERGEEATKDPEALQAHIERFGAVFRATQALPRPGHMPFLDETPVPRD